jgi:hypothetical protein
VLLTIFTLSVGLAQTVFAYLLSDASVRRDRSWFVLYALHSMLVVRGVQERDRPCGPAERGERRESMASHPTHVHGRRERPIDGITTEYAEPLAS